MMCNSTWLIKVVVVIKRKAKRVCCELENYSITKEAIVMHEQD